MSRNFQKLDLSFVDSIVNTAVHAYPGMGQSEEHKEHIKRWVTNSIATWPWQDMYGVVEDGELLASLCLFSFHLNCRGHIVAAGGIGSVQTALLHRKRKVAYDMLLASLRQYRHSGVSLVTLYPFRPGFYRKMGFGYGAEIRRYQVSPKDFPSRPVAGTVRMMNGSDEDRNVMMACYDRFFQRTNGVSARLDRSMGDAFTTETSVLGYEEDGVLKGYIVLEFVPQYVLKSNLKVRELVYDAPEALMAFSGFLHGQTDQFEQIIVETQDETLQFLLDDLASHTYDAFESRYVETCSVGVGLMYRVVDTAGMFEAMAGHRFDVPDLTLKLSISDDFLPENDGCNVLKFQDGMVTVMNEGPWDVEVWMEIGTFSSLWLGAVDFRSLLRLGLATVSSEEWIAVLQHLFRTNTKPMCWQHF